MKRELMIQNVETVLKQRNALVGFSLLLLVCLLLVSIKLLFTTEKTIMVPGLSKEAWITNEGVSSSYLEETTAMYLPMLLDLDVNSIDWKRDRLVSYVSQSDPKYIEEIYAYFARVKENYTNFALSTHFALKKLESNPKTLVVIAHGQMVQHFGNRGNQTDSSSYKIEFEWMSGKLLLKEFKKLSKEDLL